MVVSWLRRIGLNGEAGLNWCLAFFCGLGGVLSGVARAEIPYATDAPPPLPPAESVDGFVLPSDLRIELVASEPLIQEPGAICFDEAGHLYVGELHGYNLEGYYDILELNKTGELDLSLIHI